nr:hypothetical protein [Allomuricauda sp.]
MKKALLILVLVGAHQSCNLNLDEYERAKFNVVRGNYNIAKDQLTKLIDENHPQKDSALVWLRIIDSLEINADRIALEKTTTKYISAASNTFEHLNELESKAIPDDIESILIEAQLYQNFGTTLETLELLEGNQEASELANKLQSKLIKTQTSRFPKLRKKYGELLDNKMWEHNIDVRTGNTGNKTINLTGGAFANNANIKDFQESLEDQIKSLRFTEVRYRWYKGSDEYQYYKYKDANDKKLN